jgi:hypothetical protein
MSHYTELSPSLNALANKNEPTEWSDSTTVARPLHDRANVHGITWGDMRTKIICLSARSHVTTS